MATFSIRFLGCKVSHTDAQAIRERLIADSPGRGYGDDYTPWLVDAAVGDLVRVRAERVVEEGIVGVPS